MKLNADGTLSLPAAELTAQQLDELLLHLAELRRQMKPAVPTEPAPGQYLSWTKDATCMAPTHTSNGVELLFRHPGFGWLCFGLGDAQAATLGRTLTELTARSKSFLDPTLPGRDSTH